MGMPYSDQNPLGEGNNNSDSDGRVLLNTHIDIYINICISSGKCYLWRRKFGIFACIGIPTCRGGFTGHVPKASACSPLSCTQKMQPELGVDQSSACPSFSGVTFSPRVDPEHDLAKFIQVCH